MKTLCRLSISFLLIWGIHSMILFPEDIPTALNLIYSRLPPVRAGKDTRVGVGFRMGENVDAQVIVEVGPQANTQPLIAMTGDNLRRRQTDNRNESNETDNGIMTTASWTVNKLKNVLKHWFSMLKQEFSKSGYNNTEEIEVVDNKRTLMNTSP